MSGRRRAPSRVTGPRGGWPAAFGLAAVVGAASLALPATLGYDAWAWTVWGRQLAHLDLDTTAGPSFKPLPVLVLAPLSVLGGATPVVWMALMRAAAVLSLAARLPARRAPGRPAGGRGRRAEPGAERRPLPHRAAGLRRAGAHRAHARRRRPPPRGPARLGARADRGGGAHPPRGVGPARRSTASMLWLREPRLRPLAVGGRRAAAGAVARPGLDRLGRSAARELDRDVGHRGQRGERQRARLRGRAPRRRRRSSSPRSCSRRVGIVAAVRRRDRAVLSLAALALGWIAVVAIMAEVGFTGTRRYLAAPAAALCVVAGVGFVWLLDAVTRAPRAARAGRRDRPAGARARAAARPRGRAHAQRRAQPGRPARRAARARWTASAAAPPCCAPGAPRSTRGCRRRSRGSSTCRSSGVQATWASSRRHPHWAPPALVFRAPARLAGPRPALPRGVTRRRRRPLGTLAGAARRGVSPAQALPWSWMQLVEDRPNVELRRGRDGSVDRRPLLPLRPAHRGRRAQHPAAALRLGHARVVGARRRLGRRPRRRGARPLPRADHERAGRRLAGRHRAPLGRPRHDHAPRRPRLVGPAHARGHRARGAAGGRHRARRRRAAGAADGGGRRGAGRARRAPRMDGAARRCLAVARARRGPAGRAPGA